MVEIAQPKSFWKVRVHDAHSLKGLTGLCIGYEQGKWRYAAFSDYVMEWLPEFCLNTKEREGLSHESAVMSLRKAANLVYQTDKYAKRGEFGELFLHMAIRFVFNSLPAISKLYYKSSANDTVKGFDCVHIVGTIDNLELWLGEVKFYRDIKSAIADVIAEIKTHLETNFLRKEFIWIGNKLDEKDDFTSAVQQLISERTSLDDIFKRICIPVLLTYESNVVKNYHSVCESYIKDFSSEVRKFFDSFCIKLNLPEVKIHLFLLPLDEKKLLVDALNRKLKAWQEI